MWTERRVSRRILAVVAIVLAVGVVAATGTAAYQGQKYRFADTATFNTAAPVSPKVDGPKFSTLGPVPKLGAGVKVAVLLKALTNEYWQQVEAGLNAFKAKYHVKTSKIFSASSENAQQQQLQICTTLLQQGYNAFIVSPETTSNLKPCLAKLKAKNIPIINIEAPGNGVLATVYVGPVLLNDGKLAVGYLASKVAKGAKVAHIEGLLGSSAADLRLQGYKQGVQQAGLQSVGEVAGNWDAQTAYTAAQDLLSRFPDLAGIYAANDTMAVAVARAIQQAGKTGKVVLVGTDGVPSAMTDLRSGQIGATVTPFPYYEGYWALEAAVRVLGGQKVPLWVNAPDVLITTANVASFFTSKNTANPNLYK